MKTLLMKSMIAIGIAITIAACKKSDTSNDNQATSNSQASTTTSPTTSPVTSSANEDGSLRVTAQRYGGGGSGGNQSPSCRPGADETITLPVNSVFLDGSHSFDGDGNIVSYVWIKESGTGGIITSPASAQSTVTALAAGHYKFKLTITDNKGATDSDTVHITVNGTGGTTPPANQAPVVNAGSAQTITMPASSVTVNGSATDADGTIVSYLWSKVSGNGSTVTNANAAATTITGMSTGTYVFNLKATDNAGASGNKTVAIIVNSSSTPPPSNQNPVVSVGGALSITLPVSLITLNGSATDADGSVVSYLWTKVSGGIAIIVNPNSASTTVTGLLSGSYVFNLRATDNAGATGNKTVSVTVNAVSTPPPSGNYGTLIYSTGYNQLSDIINGSNQQGNGGLSTSIFKSGPGSFKSVPANVSSGIRSEVQYSSSMTPTEGAIEYDVMYETIFSGQGHSLQFHPNTSGGSASPGLWHEGGKFTWVNWKGGTNTKYTTNYTIPRNQWIHVVYEYKFGSAGYMKFTIDGVVVLNRTNIQVGDGSGQYLKVGVNMWADQSSVVYYDNLKIWRK